MSVTVGLITDIHHGLDSKYVRGSAALPLFEGALESLLSQATVHRPELLVDLDTTGQTMTNRSKPGRNCAKWLTAFVGWLFQESIFGAIKT